MARFASSVSMIEQETVLTGHDDHGDVYPVKGVLGLLLGLITVPLIGTAAGIRLILFFVCAIHTHLLARDYSPQFGLAIRFLLLAVATLLLDLASS